MRRACAVIAAVAAGATSAHAYEFWLRAQTTGQAYQLTDFRLVGPDVYLGRRRFTQTLALRITDVGDFSHDRRVAHLPDRGLRISFYSYLRIDHDFGDYTNGRIVLPGPTSQSAIDAIPELSESAVALDLMYGYLEFEGLFDDHVTAQLGRILTDDGWGPTAFDGGQVRAELPAPAPLAVTASAGLRVRESSPLGTSQYELDGTSGAGCQEYVEGPTPGTGSWQLIDRNRDTGNTALGSDTAYCPQRDVTQPTIAVTIATARTRHFGAEVGYRRTWSDTVGLIGPVDRLQYPDLGLYPNDFGQAPSTGINEERIYGRVHGDFALGTVQLQPYADARYSILNAVFDRADAGVRVRTGDHVIEPAVEYFYPTFDGDSIFNAFSIEPTTDFHIAYQYAAPGPWKGTASVWLRRYAPIDDTTAFAGGGDASIERRLGDTWRAKLDALWDDGWGGRRVGGTAEASWRWQRELWLRGRVIVLAVRDDETPTEPVVSANITAQKYTTSSTVVSSTWRVADTVAIHAILEGDYDEIRAFQTRVIAVLDLAFLPEP